MDPGCAEAVEEVGLTGEDGFVEVGVAEFADVDLEEESVRWLIEWVGCVFLGL